MENRIEIMDQTIHVVFTASELEYIERALLSYDSDHGSTPGEALVIQIVSDAKRYAVEGYPDEL